MKAKPASRNGRRYAEIVCAVNKAPQTIRELSVMFACGLRTTRGIVLRMEQLGVLRAVEWRPNSFNHGPYVGVYEFSDAASVPCPVRNIRPEKPSAWNIRPELVAFATVIRLLRAGNASRGDMSQASGLNSRTVGLLVASLREKKLIRVSGYGERAAGGQRAELFSIGSGRDAKRPPPIDGNELCRRYYRRKIAKIDTNPFRDIDDEHVRRSVVDARRVKMPQTSAANSVFALGAA